MKKASLVKGTRDFGPKQVQKRKHIFGVIEKVFRKYGFAALETPSMENLTTLTGKYGDEGDQLLFKILKNGSIQEKAQIASNEEDFYQAITDKGLRYDLTVPFARYVSMNRHEIKFPFKRYQMQQVWRADRPQKGRYREFWQCDADSIGTKSLICEMECLSMFDEAFELLNIPVKIHLNHRKLLEAIAIELGFKDNFIDFTVAVDKLDKIGKEGVIQELQNKELDTSLLETQFDLLTGHTFNKETLAQLEARFNSAEGQSAIADLKELWSYCSVFSNQVILDTSLARGLSYYTGCIFEVKPTDANMGSVAAGGRYDDLTEVFGVKDVSGVGISFGADRIYDILEQEEKFPKENSAFADVLICCMDKSALPFGSKIAQQIRTNKSVILYPSAAKLKKQLDYANAIEAQYAVIIGSNEVENKSCTIKDLIEGSQENVHFNKLERYFA